MQRRTFLTKAAMAATATSTALLAACGSKEKSAGEAGAPAVSTSKKTAIKWRLQTYAGPALAEHVIKPSIEAFNKAANGDMVIELYFADQLVPTGELFRAMQRGTIDGYMLPYEAVKGFRVYEVSDHHTEFGFYSLAFVQTMNKARYESLPADLKKVIDNNSGMAWAIRAGKGFDQGDSVGLEATKGTGAFHKIEGSELSEWQAAADRTTAGYLKELDDQGLPGTETYTKVKGYVADCRAELKG